MRDGRRSAAVRACVCCNLPQPSRLDQFDVTAANCEECKNHNGDTPQKRLARAETHERILRERLEACRASEAAAQASLRRAEQEIQQQKGRVAAALGSRGSLAAELVAAVERSGHHRCEVQTLVLAPRVRDWAKLFQQRESTDDW